MNADILTCPILPCHTEQPDVPRLAVHMAEMHALSYAQALQRARSAYPASSPLQEAPHAPDRPAPDLGGQPGGRMTRTYFQRRLAAA